MNDDDPIRDARGSARPFGQGRRPNATDGLEKLFDALGGSRASGRFERIMRDVTSWFDDETVASGTRGGTVHEGRPSDADASGHRAPDTAPNAGDPGADGVRGAYAHDDGYADEDVDASGSFRGRGPRNYRRSDERVAELVNDALHDDAALDARDIEVSVTDGRVALSGTVARRRDKHRAENVAARAAGVPDVDNRVRVERPDDAGGSRDAPGGTPGEAERDADDYGHP